MIAAITPCSPEASTWDSTVTGWRKWLAIYKDDGINFFLADGTAVLGYLRWLHSSNRVSGATLKQYLSYLRLAYGDPGPRLPHFTTHSRHAIDAIRAAHAKRRTALASASARTDLPASVALGILAAVLHSHDLSFLRAAIAEIVGYIFSSHDTAGFCLPAAAIRTKHSKASPYTTIRKNQGKIPYSLQCRRNENIAVSCVEHFLKHSLPRQATRTAAKGLWHSLGNHRCPEDARIPSSPALQH